MTNLLFYAATDWRHHHFVCPYTVTALTTNPDARVEVLIRDYDMFMEQYGNCVGRIIADFGKRVLFRNIDRVKDIDAHYLRYWVEPITPAQIIYITDMDFLFCDYSRGMFNWGLSELERCGSFCTVYQRINENDIPSQERISGVLFVKPVFFAGVKQIDPNRLRDIYNATINSDEIFIRRIIEEIDPLIKMDSAANRKLKAFHMSINRRPFNDTLDSFNTKDFAQLTAMTETSVWNNYFPFFGEKFQATYNKYMEYGNKELEKCLR
ncbi:MAG: hypothetical protein V1709_08625 [Planctomycetota bacterium]